MGRALVWHLLAAGHRVTILNRGNLPDPFGDRIERVRADRSSDQLDARLAGRAFDRVIDFACFTAADVDRLVHALAGRVGHYLMISTGQVYLVRAACPRPSREADYAGAVLAAPPTPADDADWRYGIDKRAAEDAVVAAADRLPATRLRLPMVNGEADPKRRIEGYLWRLLDGGPLLVANPAAIARHVYAGAVVRTLTALVAAPPPPGHAYNLAQPEELPVRELVARIATRAGGRAAIIEADADELDRAGISARAASPYSSPWMSHLDPARAVDELGFRHPPLDAYLDAILASLHAAWPAEPPPGYDQRPAELAFARGHRG